MPGKSVWLRYSEKNCVLPNFGGMFIGLGECETRWLVHGTLTGTIRLDGDNGRVKFSDFPKLGIEDCVDTESGDCIFKIPGDP